MLGNYSNFQLWFPYNICLCRKLKNIWKLSKLNTFKHRKRQINDKITTKKLVAFSPLEKSSNDSFLGRINSKIKSQY